MGLGHIQEHHLSATATPIKTLFNMALAPGLEPGTSAFVARCSGPTELYKRGGEREIRTHGRLVDASDFQGRRNKPLCQLSVLQNHWCAARDSNSHALRRWILNPLRLPFRQPRTLLHVVCHVVKERWGAPILGNKKPGLTPGFGAGLVQESHDSRHAWSKKLMCLTGVNACRTDCVCSVRDGCSVVSCYSSLNSCIQLVSQKTKPGISPGFASGASRESHDSRRA